jgi:hypothetical protein
MVLNFKGVQMHVRYAAAFFLVPVLAAVTAQASERPFTFSYDTYALGKGGVEFEQWATWKNHKEDEVSFNRFEFREELELGLADNFTLGLYLPSWSYESSVDRDSLKFDSIDVEGIVYLSNPVEDFLGVGLYAEVKVGEGEVEFENKLLLQKDIGNWTFVYNLVLETEVEGIFNEHDEENEVEGVLGHTFGAAYAVTPSLFLGGEAVVESVYEDWSEYEGTTVYAGPVVSLRNIGGTKAWATFTPTFQLTDVEEEPDFQFRLIVGYQF